MTVMPTIVTPLTTTAIRSDMTAPINSADAQALSLTAAMARGDEEAFRAFHDAYFNRLLRYLFVVTRGDDEAARDALQETFVRVARHVRAFNSADAFWSWLTVLARSAARDGSRKRGRYGRLIARFTVLWQRDPDEINPPEECDLEAMLADALAVLDHTDRAIVEGKYLRGASVRMLADEIQLTEKAIESRLSRARKQLREELQKRLRHET
jgi:RNA polymerase sigma factor (sigma-70 family)